MYLRTIRGTAQKLVQGARSRASKRLQPCEVDLDDILDMMFEQRRRCYYSGIPLVLSQPHSHWRVSLERFNNDEGYVRKNCALVCHEFNTPDYCRNRAVHAVSGTAQWSRDKVEQVWGPLPEWLR